MKALSLFAGIGGLDIAAEWAGIKTVAFCEIEPYAQAILAKHWPGIPIYEDVVKLDGKKVAGIDVVMGGFPCPAFSAAGKKGGFEQDGLFWEFVRVCREARPRFVVAENVENFVHWRGEAIGAFEGLGYDVADGVLDARDFGVPQSRRRWFMLGVRGGMLPSSQHLRRVQGNQAPDIYSLFPNATNSKRRWTPTVNTKEEWRAIAASCRKSRAVDGLPHRMDRLRCLGNAVVPSMFYPIFRLISELGG